MRGIRTYGLISNTSVRRIAATFRRVKIRYIDFQKLRPGRNMAFDLLTERPVVMQVPTSLRQDEQDSQGRDARRELKTAIPSSIAAGHR